MNGACPNLSRTCQRSFESTVGLLEAIEPRIGHGHLEAVTGLIAVQQVPDIKPVDSTKECEATRRVSPHRVSEVVTGVGAPCSCFEACCRSDFLSLFNAEAGLKTAR